MYTIVIKDDWKYDYNHLKKETTNKKRKKERGSIEWMIDHVMASYVLRISYWLHSDVFESSSYYFLAAVLFFVSFSNASHRTDMRTSTFTFGEIEYLPTYLPLFLKQHMFYRKLSQPCNKAAPSSYYNPLRHVVAVSIESVSQPAAAPYLLILVKR